MKFSPLIKKYVLNTSYVYCLVFCKRYIMTKKIDGPCHYVCSKEDRHKTNRYTNK